MSFLDDAKKKLGDAVDKHGDTIAGGIDKAAAAANQKTKGKYSDKIESGTTRAKDALDARAAKRDGDAGTGPTRPVDPTTP